MRTKHWHWPGLFALLVFAAGCQESTDIVEPAVDGKADIADRVSPKGAIDFDRPISDEFSIDMEFHGYVLRAAGGAEISAETTRLGSSRNLDTTLFVFGPRDAANGFGDVAIAKDNDAGFGKLSRLTVTPEVDGDYLVVVGTALGDGRGKYRLLIGCNGTTCTPEPGSCPPEIENFIVTCAEFQILDGHTDNFADAIETCLHTPFAGLGDEPGDVFDQLCELGAPPDWCTRGVDVFVDELIPLCEAEILAR